jgi:hemerythrin-like domain-containing protein
MTTLDVREHRTDLFTDIHKALRKGLFDLSVKAGATDWHDSHSVAALAAEWLRMAELLRSHTEHENDYIFPLLDGTAGAGVVPEDDHTDLDDLLDDLDDQFSILRSEPDPAAGLTWYRNLNRYLALTLDHLYLEETTVLPALWSVCDDDQLEQCRAAFLAATPPAVVTTTVALFRAALPTATLEAMGLAC